MSTMSIQVILPPVCGYDRLQNHVPSEIDLFAFVFYPSAEEDVAKSISVSYNVPPAIPITPPSLASEQMDVACVASDMVEKFMPFLSTSTDLETTDLETIRADLALFACQETARFVGNRPIVAVAKDGCKFVVQNGIESTERKPAKMKFGNVDEVLKVIMVEEPCSCLELTEMRVASVFSMGCAHACLRRRSMRAIFNTGNPFSRSQV